MNLLQPELHFELTQSSSSSTQTEESSKKQKRIPVLPEEKKPRLVKIK